MPIKPPVVPQDATTRPGGFKFDAGLGPGSNIYQGPTMTKEPPQQLPQQPRVPLTDPQPIHQAPDSYQGTQAAGSMPMMFTGEPASPPAQVSPQDSSLTPEALDLEQELIDRRNDFIKKYGKIPRSQRPPSAAQEEAEIRRMDVELQGLKRSLRGNDPADPQGPPLPPPGMRASPMGYIPDQGIYNDPRLEGTKQWPIGTHPIYGQTGTHFGSGVTQIPPENLVPGQNAPLPQGQGELSVPNQPGHGYGSGTAKEVVEQALNEATQSAEDIGVPGAGADIGLIQRIKRNRQKRKQERQQRRGR